MAIQTHYSTPTFASDNSEQGILNGIQEQLEEYQKLQPSDRVYAIIENNTPTTFRLICFPFPFTLVIENLSLRAKQTAPKSDIKLISNKLATESPLLCKIKKLVQDKALIGFKPCVYEQNEDLSALLQQQVQLVYKQTLFNLENLDNVINAFFNPNTKSDQLQLLIKTGLSELEALMNKLGIDPKTETDSLLSNLE